MIETILKLLALNGLEAHVIDNDGETEISVENDSKRIRFFGEEISVLSEDGTESIICASDLFSDNHIAFKAVESTAEGYVLPKSAPLERMREFLESLKYKSRSYIRTMKIVLFLWT